MIVADSKTNSSTDFFDNVSDFSIQNSGKAFQILSSGIYSNKIGAVVRELACNARDAMVAAGKQDEPFEIHLPSTDKRWFSVKDTGIGLSKEDVISLYSTYFKSTKTTSNDFIGAFGLGSKSPFAYTTAFAITSIYGGKKMYFNAFISEDGTPKIVMTAEEDTQEPCGVEVKVPCKNWDETDFRINTKNYLKYFNPLPKIVNYTDFSWDNHVPEFSGSDWDYNKMNSGFFLIQGGVPYQMFKQDFLSVDVNKMISTLNMNVYFDIGELEITASRESVSFNAQTQKNISDKLNKVRQELLDTVENCLMSFKGTEWQKQIAIKDFTNNNRSIHLFSQNLFSLYTKYSLEIDMKQVTKGWIRMKSAYTGSYKSFAYAAKDTESSLTFKFSASLISDNTYFVVADDAKKNLKDIKNHFEQTLKKDFDISTIVLLEEFGEDELPTVMNMFVNPPLIRTSSIQKVQRVKTEKVVQVLKNESFVYLPSSRDFTRKFVEVAPDKDGIVWYVERKHDKSMYKGNEVNTSHAFCFKNTYESLVDDGFAVCRTTPSELARLKKSYTVKNFFEHIEEKLKEYVERNKEYFSAYLSKESSPSAYSFNCFMTALINLNTNSGGTYLSELEGTDFLKFVKQTEKNEAFVERYQVKKAIQALYLEPKLLKDIEFVDTQKLLDEVFIELPMLKHYNFSYLNTTKEDIDIIVDYATMAYQHKRSS